MPFSLGNHEIELFLLCMKSWPEEGTKVHTASVLMRCGLFRFYNHWLLTNLLMLIPAVVDCYLGGLSELYLASCLCPLYSPPSLMRDLAKKLVLVNRILASVNDASRGFISTCPLRLGCVFLECSFLEAHLHAI